MAAPVLSEEQRLALVEWLAAGHPEPLIHMLFQARGWKPIHHSSIGFHRDRHREEIDRRRKEREARAYDAGLAQRDARIKALVRHAETLQQIMWQADEKGKLHNEKAWRETLDDIAKELGHRRSGVDLSVGSLTDAELRAEAARYFGAVRPSGTEEGESTESDPLPE
jgi:hypothetical protein